MSVIPSHVTMPFSLLIILEGEMEQWRPVVGYEGLYEVSNLGRVKSFSYKARVLKQNLDPRGRPVIFLSLDCKKGTRRIHTLVAEAFIGSRPDGAVVCHKDGNTLNCSVSNLYYGTMKQNMADRERHGNTAKGVKNGRTPLTDNDVRQIKRLRRAGATLQSIADAFGVTHQSIWQIVFGKTWTHVR